MIVFNVCIDLVVWLVRNCCLKKEVIFIVVKKKNIVKCIIYNFGIKEVNGLVLIFIRWRGYFMWGRRLNNFLSGLLVF